MPKIPYTNNLLSSFNNPLPFPNYLNSISLLTDTSNVNVDRFFNANKSIGESLLLTLIAVIQEGLAHQLSGLNMPNKSQIPYHNSNCYYFKGIPEKPLNKLRNTTINKQIYSVKYSTNTLESKTTFSSSSSSSSSLHSFNSYISTNPIVVTDNIPNCQGNAKFTDGHNESHYLRSSKTSKNSGIFANIFTLFKLLKISECFKSYHEKKSKTCPRKRLELLDEKEKWEEIKRIYNETIYNMKAEEYQKNKSMIFKNSAGLTVQGYYCDSGYMDDMDDGDTNNDTDNEDSEIIDIFSRVKEDTLKIVDIKDCWDSMSKVAIYQFFVQCPINHYLRKFASKLFSYGKHKYSPILRFLFVTCVISPIQISVNILTLSLTNKKTPSEIKKCFSDNFTHILKLSLLIVPLCTQYFARTFLPRHLWVPFFNMSSFILGTYIKLIMKRKCHTNKSIYF